MSSNGAGKDLRNIEALNAGNTRTPAARHLFYIMAIRWAQGQYLEVALRTLQFEYICNG